MSGPVGGPVGGSGQEPDVRPGVRIGVDVGSVRVGVAASDPGGVLAVPVTTLARDKRHNADIEQLVQIARDRQAVEVVVGLPRQMSGQEGQAVRVVRRYVEVLAERIAPVPVRFVDERLTTVAAHRRMAERGVRSRARRSLVDQEAAVQILQHDLDSRRRRGDVPGVPGSTEAFPQDSR
ncbi:Holliday junction resolvase RuvX [Frankia tisae]|uniref:Holliday junction resolvase RuvX n=1 Tax=Frankia tisae TaxID=2950104 RepID=UPI0021BFD24B|nr:Holliday junction resolvase RuvX [Frankia tisae]